MRPTDLSAGLVSNLVRPAPDVALIASLRAYITLVSGTCDDFAFIGSVGLQTYLPTYQRQPRDVDVLVPEDVIGNIMERAVTIGLEVQDDPVAACVVNEVGLKLQLIPHHMRWIDRNTREIFARPLLYSSERIAVRDFRSAVIDEHVSLRTPALEYLIGMNLVQPLGSELYTLFSAVLFHNNLDLSVLAEFFGGLADFVIIASDRVDRILVVAAREQSPDLGTWTAVRALLADIR